MFQKGQVKMKEEKVEEWEEKVEEDWEEKVEERWQVGSELHKFFWTITRCNITPEDVVLVAHVLPNLIAGKRAGTVSVSLTLAHLTNQLWLEEAHQGVTPNIHHN